MFEPISRKEYHKILNGKKMLGKENCPFCNIVDGNDDVNHILWEGKFWGIIYNLASYSGDHRHIMAIPKDHVCYSKDLNTDHLGEFGEVHAFVKEYFGEEKYFSFTRETMDCRSVEHLHIHFLAGELQGRFLRKMLELQGYPITQELNLE